MHNNSHLKNLIEIKYKNNRILFIKTVFNYNEN